MIDDSDLGGEAPCWAHLIDEDDQVQTLGQFGVDDGEPLGGDSRSNGSSGDGDDETRCDDPGSAEQPGT